MRATEAEAVTAGRRSPEAAQLRLLEVATPAWRLDRRTREIGRRGVASAREALRQAGAAGGEGRHSDQAA